MFQSDLHLSYVKNRQLFKKIIKPDERLVQRDLHELLQREQSEVRQELLLLYSGFDCFDMPA